MRTRPSLSPDLRQERLSTKEIERQAGGRSNKTPARSCRCFPQRVVSRMKSARLAVFGNRHTEKEKSPVAHRAFPVLSPVKASCAKKSVTTPNGQRGKTEAPHISRGGLPSTCGKKVTSKGLERDGLGHHVSGAMTSLVIAWFPPKWNPKAPAFPRARGFFLLSTEQRDADPSKWRRMC